MPVSKLKNLVILILLLANLALLALLLPARVAQSREADDLKQSLSDLYAAQDVILDPAIIPDTVTLYVLELGEDASAGLQAAKALLGDQLLAQEDSTRYLQTYASQYGSCSIGRTGSFQAGLSGLEESGDLAKAARKTLKAMGFTVNRLEGPTRLRAGVYTLTATQSILGVPVFSGGLTLTYTNNSLTALDGAFYTGGDALRRISGQSCLSAADALVDFLSARFDLGWVGSEITGMTQGYLRSETASVAAVHLTPVWLLETDTGSFYINGSTGEITAAE